MESHPTLEELMARPAQQRHRRLWSGIATTSMVVFVLAFLIAWLHIPDWLVPWWLLAFILLLIIFVLIMRRVEQWWWSTSPWAWRRL